MYPPSHLVQSQSCLLGRRLMLEGRTTRGAPLPLHLLLLLLLLLVVLLLLLLELHRSEETGRHTE